MQFDSREVSGNGPEKNFVECPVCEQKLLSVSLLKGMAEVIVKCRRCHSFIKIRMIP